MPAMAELIELTSADIEHFIEHGFVLVKDCIDLPWVSPSPQAEGWHVDGDFFLHFLDSPEQALLTVVLWNDVLPKSGATFLACDSVGPVARFLAAHPEGIEPGGFRASDLAGQCRDFREAVGQAGDVYLLHPLMLHARSRNPSGRARFITNPCPSLKEPMRFERGPGEHSAVERATLRALGVRHFAFHSLSPRRRFVPARIAEEAKKRVLLERTASR